MPVVATVFVNPTQFGPREDFGKYPRTLEQDVALAERCGADAVFAPAAETVYPDGLEAAQLQRSGTGRLTRQRRSVQDTAPLP
jgi:pantothenate synthetase